MTTPVDPQLTIKTVVPNEKYTGELVLPATEESQSSSTTKIILPKKRSRQTDYNQKISDLLKSSISSFFDAHPTLIPNQEEYSEMVIDVLELITYLLLNPGLSFNQRETLIEAIYNQASEEIAKHVAVYPSCDLLSLMKSLNAPLTDKDKSLPKAKRVKKSSPSPPTGGATKPGPVYDSEGNVLMCE